MGGCVQDQQGISESPHPAEGTRPPGADQCASPLGNSPALQGSGQLPQLPPHCGKASLLWEPGDLCCSSWSPTLPGFTAQGTATQAADNCICLGRLVHCLLPRHPRLRFSSKDWSKWHRWSILGHAAISSRPFSLHYAWNYYQEGDSYSFKYCWGCLFNH